MFADHLPAWQCHKVVRASKIASITPLPHGGALVHLEHGAGEVDAGWLQRHKADVGGYVVVYDDGYTSFSPAASFESGYSLISQGAPA